MNCETDYFLGAGDDEIARLALQHRVWRSRALDAWRRAGFATGQTVVDIGCGPGNASIDLAKLVGPAGRVVAIDQSRRFLDVLDTERQARSLNNIETIHADLDDANLCAIEADGVWCRWVLAFVKQPRKLLERITELLKPGGALVMHEYFDYSTWRLAPRCPEIEEFVSAVIATWRANGGEPNIALDIPRWLHELGFEVTALNPIIEFAPVSSPAWQWLRAFIDANLGRLVDLGRLRSDRAVEIASALAAREEDSYGFTITPAVLEIIAVRH